MVAYGAAILLAGETNRGKSSVHQRAHAACVLVPSGYTKPDGSRRPRGGTGIRMELKIPGRKACGFESHRGHFHQRQPPVDRCSSLSTVWLLACALPARRDGQRASTAYVTLDREAACWQRWQRQPPVPSSWSSLPARQAGMRLLREPAASRPLPWHRQHVRHLPRDGRGRAPK